MFLLFVRDTGVEFCGIDVYGNEYTDPHVKPSKSGRDVLPDSYFNKIDLKSEPDPKLFSAIQKR